MMPTTTKVTNPEPSLVVAPVSAIDDTTEQVNVGGAPIPQNLKLNLSQVGHNDFLSELFPIHH